MFPYKFQNRLPIILALAISSILGLTFLVYQVVAEPKGPAATNSSSWFVQDNYLTGDKIDMVSINDGWILNLGDLPSFNDQSAYIYRWNGTRWSLFTTLSHTQPILRADIHMVSANDGWIVLGGPHGGSSNLAESTIYRWDGDSWSAYGTMTAPDGVSLGTIDMLSPTEGWASGPLNFGAIYYYWDGTSWELFSQNSSDYTGNDLDMVSPSDGWSVGGELSHWDGTSWSVVTSPVIETLNSISMISQSDGWAVGGGFMEYGAIIRWDGVSWEKIDSPVPAEERFMAIDMISSDDGWIVGESGTILRWDGESWTKHAGSSISPYFWMSIDMLSSNIGWVTGYGGVIVYESRVVLSPSAIDGSPGSYFSLTGSNYPPNEEASVNVNGHDLGTVTTDDNGGFTLILSTAEADEGIYTVTVSANPSTTTQFILDAAAPFRPQEGEGTEINVPAGIAMTIQLFVPAVTNQVYEVALIP